MNITWVIDTHYIDVGEALDIGDGDGSYLHTLSFFTKILNKSCYLLNVVPNAPYNLLRLVFAAGNCRNYCGFQQLSGFTFSIETLSCAKIVQRALLYVRMKIVIYVAFLLHSSSYIFHLRWYIRWKKNTMCYEITWSTK